MNVRDYLTKGDIKGAIQCIPDDMIRIQISSQLSALNRQEMMGTIDQRDINLERNRIVVRILTACGSSPTPTNQPQEKLQEMKEVTSLSELYTKHRRRHPEFAAMVMSLIKKYQDHQTANIKPGYDNTGRRYKALEALKATIIEKSKELLLDVKEAKTEKILSLLSEPVPSYNKLQEAWDLAKGLGMYSVSVRTSLEGRPDDDEVKIRIAEDIENFVNKQ